jgi:quercetin dioxygenase-like cupin family protein
LRLALHEHPDGVEVEAGPRVVYDLERNEAWFGAARVSGHALVWELGGDGAGAALLADVELDAAGGWVVRCDRIDFPPGGVAHRHVHPGPGIRRLLHGELTIEAEGIEQSFGPGEAWFEGADYPVLATASASEGTAFVRVLLLPREWEGKRTIRYLDPADEAKPKLQRATVLLEKPVSL